MFSISFGKNQSFDFIIFTSEKFSSATLTIFCTFDKLINGIWIDPILVRYIAAFSIIDKAKFEPSSPLSHGILSPYQGEFFATIFDIPETSLII